MPRALDVTVVLPPALRPIFEGRREVTLGVPASTTVGEILETLLRLYPRLSQHFAGDTPVTGGSFVQLALDEASLEEMASGGTGLSTGGRLILFSLSRPSPGVRPGA